MTQIQAETLRDDPEEGLILEPDIIDREVGRVPLQVPPEVMEEIEAGLGSLAMQPLQDVEDIKADETETPPLSIEEYSILSHVEGLGINQGRWIVSATAEGRGVIRSVSNSTDLPDETVKAALINLEERKLLEAKTKLHGKRDNIINVRIMDEGVSYLRFMEDEEPDIVSQAEENFAAGAAKNVGLMREEVLNQLQILGISREYLAEVEEAVVDGQLVDERLLLDSLDGLPLSELRLIPVRLEEIQRHLEIMINKKTGYDPSKFETRRKPRRKLVY